MGEKGGLAPGLEALYAACRRTYPDQPNPLQVAALLKYWLGGPDPLDYISMYCNGGNPQLCVPPHWHYISFGLSDLHGDGRVHRRAEGDGGPSGFGFELTFRLKREQGETAPPTWPASLLQALAKYIFHSDNTLCAGDHVSWHCALDERSDSLIQHMLLCEDAGMAASVATPTGQVSFIQVVGVTKEELNAAQRWNGLGVIDILRNIPRGGGGGWWLVTDMRRGESMAELDDRATARVDEGIQSQGSNLSGVTAAFCAFHTISPHLLVGGVESKEEKDEEESPPSPSLFSGEDGAYSFEERLECAETKRLESVHLSFNLESGSLLPLAIRGRVKHGRHFTFKSGVDRRAVTLVAESVTGTFVDEESPYAVRGGWLQVLIPTPLADTIADALLPLQTHPHQMVLPKTFIWAERKLAITIVSDSLSGGSLS